LVPIVIADTIIESRRAVVARLPHCRRDTHGLGRNDDRNEEDTVTLAAVPGNR
jgi:hypothetical protein